MIDNLKVYNEKEEYDDQHEQQLTNDLAQEQLLDLDEQGLDIRSYDIYEKLENQKNNQDNDLSGWVKTVNYSNQLKQKGKAKEKVLEQSKTQQQFKRGGQISSVFQANQVNLYKTQQNQNFRQIRNIKSTESLVRNESDIYQGDQESELIKNFNQFQPQMMSVRSISIQDSFIINQRWRKNTQIERQNEQRKASMKVKNLINQEIHQQNRLQKEELKKQLQEQLQIQKENIQLQRQKIMKKKTDIEKVKIEPKLINFSLEKQIFENSNPQNKKIFLEQEENKKTSNSNNNKPSNPFKHMVKKDNTNLDKYVILNQPTDFYIQEIQENKIKVSSSPQKNICYQGIGNLQNNSNQSEIIISNNNSNQNNLSLVSKQIQIYQNNQNKNKNEEDFQVVQENSNQISNQTSEYEANLKQFSQNFYQTQTQNDNFKNKIIYQNQQILQTNPNPKIKFQFVNFNLDDKLKNNSKDFPTEQTAALHKNHNINANRFFKIIERQQSQYLNTENNNFSQLNQKKGKSLPIIESKQSIKIQRMRSQDLELEESQQFQMKVQKILKQRKQEVQKLNSQFLKNLESKDPHRVHKLVSIIDMNRTIVQNRVFSNINQSNSIQQQNPNYITIQNHFNANSSLQMIKNRSQTQYPAFALKNNQKQDY